MYYLKTGQGEDNFFLTENDGEYKLLSYEFDSYRIHKIGGGKTTYVSKSGYSREGYIETLENLIPVGGYRVDLEFNNWKRPVEAKDGIKIMVPYKNHERDKEETLQFNPVVILTGNSIIYCGYYTTMNDVLRTLFSGREFEIEPSINKQALMERNFIIH